MIRNLLRRWFPAWTTTFRACQILSRELGLLRSCREGQCVDAQGNCIPWYTYPAIEMLRQWDFRQCEVFEYGSGNSTQFWAKRAAKVHAIEENAGWYERVRSRMPANAECQLARKRQQYIDAPLALGKTFDVIIVDGRLREACAHVALQVLRPGGLIILDNSDWYHSAADVLRSTGLIQVDFTGFSPLNSFCSTTSFFLHREFRIPSASTRQPAPGIGSVAISRVDSVDFECFDPE